MKKILACGIACLFGSGVTSAFAANTQVNNNNVIVTDLAVAQPVNNGKCQNLPTRKKFRIGLEFGGGVRADLIKTTFKEDCKTQLYNFITTTSKVNVSQTDLATAVGHMLNEKTQIVRDLKELSDENKTKFSAAISELRKIVAPKQFSGEKVSAEDIKASIDTICEVLNITNNSEDDPSTTHTYAVFHSPDYINVLCAFFNDLSLIKREVTVDEIQNSLITTGKKALDPITNIDTKKWDYVNFDVFANVFCNIPISDCFYIIGGIGANFDIEGKNGRSIKGKTSKKSDSETSSSDTSSDEFLIYHTKYSITPQVGLGIQCTDKFAIEIVGYDQITKVKYDCSGIYKKSPEAAKSKILTEEVFPNKEQSCWVNRYGVGAGAKYNITQNVFVKGEMFYTFPRNIFKTMKPFDVKIQSIGARFSLGVVF